MSRIIMLIPTSASVGLNNVIFGLMHAIERKGISLSLFTPVKQYLFHEKSFYNTARTTYMNLMNNDFQSLSINYVESLLISNQKDVLIEEIMTHFYEKIQKKNVVLIKGLIPTNKHQFAMTLNYEIARALNAEIVFILTLGKYAADHINNLIELICLNFGGKKNKNIIGIIINKLNAPINRQGRIQSNLLELFKKNSKIHVSTIDQSSISKYSALPVLGCIPWNYDFRTIHAIDIAQHLNAAIIQEGEIRTRQLKSIVFCTNSLPSILKYFKSGALLIMPSDRFEILISACFSAMNGVAIGAILLTGKYKINPNIIQLCKHSFQTGLPILNVKTNILQTAINLKKFSFNILLNDHYKTKKFQQYIASHIDHVWIQSLSSPSEQTYRLLSPAVFRYNLIKLARQYKKCIILPEGEEPRTVQAASVCAERNIAHCVLLGDPEKIKRVATLQGITFFKNIEIINPKIVRKQYITRLVTLRQDQGMTESMACEQLEDNVVLATLMLEQGEVDGLVSGTIHTTAHTIRPSFQLIKTAQKGSLVSSIFFMLLPEQVLIYGDCAINIDPTAEQLADIAIQSADSAIDFGIKPYVAMLSYSTGNSGTGQNVEKIREATQLAKKKRPSLIIDGPLQYDAAIADDVGLLKAPHSPVAGKATVLIFPDLNTGNITYKAVQRSANVSAIGPILQGMRKPVNDLSRGALTEDIVYTIALTAIQSKQIQSKQIQSKQIEK